VGFERVAIFGLIELQLDATLGGQLYLSTDLPGNAMAVRETKTVPATARRVVRFRLQGTTKGRLYSVKVSPAGGGIIRLYGGRIWARVLPGAEWQWYALPIPETGDWTPSKLPIPETGDWTPAKLPIPETGDWTPAKLPIPETGDWTPAKLPIQPTPQNPEWVDIPTDT
jgi:hypothetical protein